MNNNNNPPIMNNILFVETENNDYEYIFPICSSCQLFINKGHIDKSYMIANSFDFGCVDVFDNFETNTNNKNENEQTSSINQSQEHNTPYYEESTQLSDILFLNVVDNAFITPSRIYGQVVKLTSGNNAGSGMSALKAHMICFENLYESRKPIKLDDNLLSNTKPNPVGILPNFDSLGSEEQSCYQAIFIGSEEQFEHIKSTGLQF